jgi:hypothetical protein
LSPLALYVMLSAAFTWFCLIPAIFWPIRYAVQKFMFVWFGALAIGRCTGFVTMKEHPKVHHRAGNPTNGAELNER